MRYTILLFCLLLSACATYGVDEGYERYLDRKGVKMPDGYGFQHCHGYGCKFIQTVRFEPTDWQEIEALFVPVPATPEEERVRITQAIGALETKVGAIAGTGDDHWGTFQKLGNKQHDCVDETTNTTIYLSMMMERGLIKHHSIEMPSTRFPLIHSGTWPHQTAVISENVSSQFFAVDSWFHDNGFPAEIIPLGEWKDGWEPEDRREKE